MDVNLRKFWTYYQPFRKACHMRDKKEALKIIEEMGASFPGERWKGMVLDFMDTFEDVPDYIHTMMVLAPSDDNLKEYLETKKDLEEE